MLSETAIMAKLPSKFNAVVPVGSLDAYIRYANQIPMLTAEEEQDLAEKLFHKNDLEAAKKLVLSHLRFVVSVARRYAGYGLAVADLIQEGNIGLMKAVKRFDPSVGVRLVTFAAHWVKAEIHEFILRNWSIVKIATTKAQRKLFFSRQRLSNLTEESARTIAEDLGVSLKEVYTMAERTQRKDTSFDQFTHAENDEDMHHFAPAQYLEDNRYNPAEELEAEDLKDHGDKMLQQGLLLLDDRSRDILQKRWLNAEKATLQTLAAKYKVTAERIRQLEQAAMAKLKQILKN